MKSPASAVLLALALAQPAAAQEAATCDALVAGLRAIDGYDLDLPPAGPTEGWCVLDGAVLRSLLPGMPNISAAEMRMRGSGTPLDTIEVQITGLRIAPRLGDREVDERLRAIFRLQDADVEIVLKQDAAEGTVVLDRAEVRLSGGTEILLRARVMAKGLTPAALANGLVERLDLTWRNDGRLLRPVMEIVGSELTDATGSAAVDAAREAFAEVVAALPAMSLTEGAAKELEAAVAAMPQGRGLLGVSVWAPEGIGAARVAVLALSDDPLGAPALARLFDGATIGASWHPGLAP